MGRKRKGVWSETKVNIRWAGFSAENWTLLEAALGHEIKPDLRDDIEYCTGRYFALQEFEKRLPSEAVLNILAKIESLGSKLLDELRYSGAECPDNQQPTKTVTVPAGSGSPPPADEAELRRHALKYLGRELRVTSISGARETLEDLVSGCKSAKQDIERSSYGGFQPGDTWRLTVRGFASLLEHAGLPSSASRNVVNTLPPFVRFVAAWQNILPPEYRRHTHSDEALASAITRLWQKVPKPKRENAM